MDKNKIRDLFIKHPMTLLTIGEIQHLTASEETRKVIVEVLHLYRSDFPLVMVRIQCVTYYGLIGADKTTQGIDEGRKVSCIIEAFYDSLWCHKTPKVGRKHSMRYRRRKLLMSRINNRLGTLKLPQSCYYPHNSIS